MSSAVRATSNVAQGNAFFINVATLAAADILNAAGSTATFTGSAALTGALAGSVVLRDLGKTVRIPGYAPVTGVTTQRILRKVQRVNTGAMTPLVNGVPASFVNFNEGVGGTTDSGLSGFETFFIEISPVSGANTGLPKFARLSV